MSDRQAARSPLRPVFADAVALTAIHMSLVPCEPADDFIVDGNDIGKIPISPASLRHSTKSVRHRRSW